MLGLKGLLNIPGTTASGFEASSQSALQWMAQLPASHQEVYGTLQLSFKDIESRASRDSDLENAQSSQISILILQIFAFMHYESIDESIFSHAAKELNMNVNNKENQLSQISGSN